jgi:ABC-type polysaccharide/polyol phosphate transport system ATPase subunit
MNEKKIAICTRNLGKKSQLGEPQEQYHTLPDDIVNSAKAPFRQFDRSAPDEGFWALKDVSIDGEMGEVAGIIGRNGAKKNTFPRIIPRITISIEVSKEFPHQIGRGKRGGNV